MRGAVWGLLGAALAARLWLVFSTSFGDAPGLIPAFNDEAAHLNYVRYLTDGGRLPVQTTSVQEGLDEGEFEYFQPPLYYLLTQPFCMLGKKLTPGQELFWVRCVSVLFSLAGLMVLYVTLRSSFADASIARLVLFLGALGGIPLRFGSLVTNDSLLFFLSCLYFALILEILKSGCDIRLLAAGILATAAGLWTKASFLLLWPLFPGVLLRGANKSAWKAMAALIVPWLAILPWYLRNQRLYGHWIPISVGFGTPEPLESGNIAGRLYILGNYFTRSLVFPFDGFWGGGIDKIIYPLEGLAFLVFLVLGVKSLWQVQRPGFWIFAAALALNLAGYLYLNYNYSQAEARYFIPVLPFLMTLLACGAVRLAGKEKNRMFALLGMWALLPWLSVLK